MSENQRVRLSKRCLRESLIRLLQEKTIHKISVREICDGADINRTTFYKYYGSQYALLEEMESEAVAHIDEYLSEIGDRAEDTSLRLQGIFTYIQDNIDLFRLLTNNTVDTEFPGRVINLPMIQRLLKDQFTDDYDNGEFEYLYGFIVNGGFSMVKSWINKDERESPEDIALLLMKALAKLFDGPGMLYAGG